MNGHFSEEALSLFAQLAAQTQSADFSEIERSSFQERMGGFHFVIQNSDGSEKVISSPKG
jgi:hypothetical protein